MNPVLYPLGNMKILKIVHHPAKVNTVLIGVNSSKSLSQNMDTYTKILNIKTYCADQNIRVRVSRDSNKNRSIVDILNRIHCKISNNTCIILFMDITESAMDIINPCINVLYDKIKKLNIICDVLIYNTAKFEALYNFANLSNRHYALNLDMDYVFNFISDELFYVNKTMIKPSIKLKKTVIYITFIDHQYQLNWFCNAQIAGDNRFIHILLNLKLINLSLIQLRNNYKYDINFDNLFKILMLAKTQLTNLQPKDIVNMPASISFKIIHEKLMKYYVNLKNTHDAYHSRNAENVLYFREHIDPAYEFSRYHPELLNTDPILDFSDYTGVDKYVVARENYLYNTVVPDKYQDLTCFVSFQDLNEILQTDDILCLAMIVGDTDNFEPPSYISPNYITHNTFEVARPGTLIDCNHMVINGITQLYINPAHWVIAVKEYKKPSNSKYCISIDKLYNFVILYKCLENTVINCAEYNRIQLKLMLNTCIKIYKLYEPRLKKIIKAFYAGRPKYNIYFYIGLLYTYYQYHARHDPGNSYNSYVQPINYEKLYLCLLYTELKKVKLADIKAAIKAPQRIQAMIDNKSYIGFMGIPIYIIKLISTLHNIYCVPQLKKLINKDYITQMLYIIKQVFEYELQFREIDLVCLMLQTPNNLFQPWRKQHSMIEYLNNVIHKFILQELQTGKYTIFYKISLIREYLRKNKLNENISVFRLNELVDVMSPEQLIGLYRLLISQFS